MTDSTNELLPRLAVEHGTPLYVYDLARLRERVAEVRQACSGARIQLYFATMANDREPVLEQLAALGVGACVNSIPHLMLALKCGFATERIQFTSTGVSRADMSRLRASGIRLNADSPAQLFAWGECGGSEAGLRVNAASLGGRSVDRIGCEARSVPDIVTAARDSGLWIDGLHVYVGTNYQSPDEMLPALDAFFELAAKVHGLRYVNIGGGIGVDYSRQGSGFDLQRFGQGLSALSLRLRRAHPDITIVFEPGRGLVADCGTLVTAVTDVKMLNGERYAAVDASIAIFPRPLLHPETPHRIRELSTQHNGLAGATSRAMVVGRTTFSRDILGATDLTGEASPGTLLALSDAGAYSQSMASRFLGQPEPQAVFLNRAAVSDSATAPTATPPAPAMPRRAAV